MERRKHVTSSSTNLHAYEVVLKRYMPPLSLAESLNYTRDVAGKRRGRGGGGGAVQEEGGGRYAVAMWQQLKNLTKTHYATTDTC